MKPFVNTTVLTKSDFREINFHTYFKTPLYVVLNLVCIISIAVRVAEYFVYNVINLSAVIPFAIAMVFLVIIYFTTTNSQYKQNFINGNPLEFKFKADNKGIDVKVSSGAAVVIKYNMVYKSFETKNCFAFKTKDNTLFIIKKDGFSSGDAKDFSRLLKDLKNGVLPVFEAEDDSATDKAE